MEQEQQVLGPLELAQVPELVQQQVPELAQAQKEVVLAQLQGLALVLVWQEPEQESGLAL